MRLLQGDPANAGRIGEIDGPYSVFYPGVFLVRLTDGSRVPVRYDHMMLVDRAVRDKHYGELYQYRLQRGSTQMSAAKRIMQRDADILQALADYDECTPDDTPGICNP